VGRTAERPLQYDPAATGRESSRFSSASIEMRLASRLRLVDVAGRMEDDRGHYGGVTASTEVIAVKRHTGVHASVIVCKNTIANQNLAYAA
jgi:hypothetical protein